MKNTWPLRKFMAFWGTHIFLAKIWPNSIIAFTLILLFSGGTLLQRDWASCWCLEISCGFLSLLAFRHVILSLNTNNTYLNLYYWQHLLGMLHLFLNAWSLCDWIIFFFVQGWWLLHNKVELTTPAIVANCLVFLIG